MDCLRKLKELTLYTVESPFVDNTFFVEVVLEFEKGAFGLSNNRTLTIPVNIVHEKDMTINNASWEYLPSFLKPTEMKTNYLTIGYE